MFICSNFIVEISDLDPIFSRRDAPPGRPISYSTADSRRSNSSDISEISPYLLTRTALYRLLRWLDFIG
ncbi:MAG: hypothetical protein DME69_14155 [Verrucomicrobia bacterium]|nr:MAG: hypothetical protein DME69_14155 [Verrucomicrobiota bacterium]